MAVNYSFSLPRLVAPDLRTKAVLPQVAVVDHVPEPAELDPERFPSIPPTVRRMAWCTCCETNQGHYLRRVERWFQQLRALGVEADCFVFIDGKLVESPPDIDVQYVEQPFLGRQNTCVFPGWKRSFGAAMRTSLSYDACLHIESDFEVARPEKFHDWLNRSGSFAAWDRRYRMIEPSLMILNRIEDRRILADAYASEADWREEALFENRLRHLIDWVYPFKTFRLEGYNRNDSRWSGHDGFGQAGERD